MAIVVWKNQELSVTVPVRPDGRISVPLVGEVEAARRTPAELEEILTEAFEEFVTSPAVSVVVQEINSHRVFIMGEVNSSGTYDIIQPTRLLQALAMAGGLTETKSTLEVINNNKQIMKMFNRTPDGKEFVNLEMVLTRH